MRDEVASVWAIAFDVHAQAVFDRLLIFDANLVLKSFPNFIDLLVAGLASEEEDVVLPNEQIDGVAW